MSVEESSAKALTQVAQGEYKPASTVADICPIPLVLPSWIPRRYRRESEFQIVAPVADGVELPKGYIVAWSDPTNEKTYFKLYATVFPPRKRKPDSSDFAKKWEELVVAEREFAGAVVRVRRRIVIDRDTGLEREVPGYRADWARDGVKYMILDHGAALKVAQLLRIAGSMKLSRIRQTGKAGSRNM